MLSGSRKRMAYVVAHEIEVMAKAFGVEHLGFLTLTFADEVLEVKEAEKRWHSFQNNWLRHRYPRGVAVREAMKSGRIHFHAVVVTRFVCRYGPALSDEWDELRRICPAYQFGRHELRPIRKSGVAVARYLAKYLTKDYAKGRRVKFWGYDNGRERKASPRFGWATGAGCVWRAKIAKLASVLGIKDSGGFADKYGSRWAWGLKEAIANCEGDYPPGPEYDKWRAEHALIRQANEEFASAYKVAHNSIFFFTKPDRIL